MKKSELRKIIKESIKGLMSEEKTCPCPGGIGCCYSSTIHCEKGEYCKAGCCVKGSPVSSGEYGSETTDNALDSISEQTTIGMCIPQDFSPTGSCAQQWLSQVNTTSNYWQDWLAMKSNAFFNTGGGYNCQSLRNGWAHLRQQLQNGSNAQGTSWTPQQVIIKEAQKNWLMCLFRKCCLQ